MVYPQFYTLHFAFYIRKRLAAGAAAAAPTAAKPVQRLISVPQ